MTPAEIANALMGPDGKLKPLSVGTLEKMQRYVALDYAWRNGAPPIGYLDAEDAFLASLSAEQAETAEQALQTGRIQTRGIQWLKS